MPATVASHISGKALLVPVDRGSSGTSSQVAAAARTVPSPPRTTITPAPRARIATTSARVSSAVPVSASSSTNSRCGRRPALARRFASARTTPPATPMPSVETRARSTPAAPAAASSRTTMLVFSALGNTEACATRRRMSRPDIGLATIPTVEPGTTGSSPLVTALTSAVHRVAATANEGCSGVAAARHPGDQLRRRPVRRGRFTGHRAIVAAGDACASRSASPTRRCRPSARLKATAGGSPDVPDAAWWLRSVTGSCEPFSSATACAAATSRGAGASASPPKLNENIDG